MACQRMCFDNAMKVSRELVRQHCAFAPSLSVVHALGSFHVILSYYRRKGTNTSRRLSLCFVWILTLVTFCLSRIRINQIAFCPVCET